jgi:hypothetical protein
MVPPLGGVSSRSVAESRVARLLDQVDLGRDAVAFHSVHLTEHIYKQMGEIDFLVVFDDCVLVVEVKGGRVARRDGMWEFIDRDGNRNPKPEGPFAQAESAMYSLRNKMNRSIPGLECAWGTLVITTDQALPLDPEWEPWHHIGPRDMTVEGIANGLKNARKHALYRSERNRGWGAKIRAALRPDFDALPSLSTEASQLRVRYLDLIGQQGMVLEASESNQRVLCIGGAGTGKTLLAAESARRAAAQGDRVVFTCPSSTIVEYVRELLAQTEVRCIPFADLQRDAGEIDLLVIDEAQDIMDASGISEIERALSRPIDEARWRAFCDTNNQAAVNGRFDPEVFSVVRESAVSVKLSWNCRNPASVIEWTQMATGADIGAPRVGMGPRIGVERVDDPHVGITGIDQWLDELRADGVDLADVAVITMATDPSQSIAFRTSSSRKGRLRRIGSGRRTGCAVVASPAQIKGLEAEHVLVVECAQILNEVDLAGLYVAVTRATVSLRLQLATPAWDWLHERIAANATRGGTNDQG